MTLNNCGGKICRYKCRCNNRFKHTEEERSVYRQIIHYWDGGIDYYTGSELIKYNKKQKYRQRYKLLLKENIAAGLGGVGGVGMATQAALKQYRQCDCERCQENAS